MSLGENRRRTPGQTLLAGAAAGGLESLITYPTEYIKTQQQLATKAAGNALSPIRTLINVVQAKGIWQLYRGSGIFCAANATKASVRFFSYDFLIQRLPKDTQTGKPTPMNKLLSGVVAGITESVLVVTPGETIKTKMIDAQNKVSGARYSNAFSVIRNLLSTKGLRGLYCGVVPVTIKQSSNAIVRFSSYSFLLDHLNTLGGGQGRAFTSVVAGAGAGVITVYCTMPMDNIKTRLQAIDSASNGTWSCMMNIIRNEGFRSLWKGTTPRLIRLSVSGAVSFSVYEHVLMWTDRSFIGFKETAKTSGEMGSMSNELWDSNLISNMRDFFLIYKPEQL